ncbi:Heat shock 70 kDa protein 6, partial [Orchesella cincta]
MASDEHQRDSPTPSANDEREECFLQLINVTRHNDNDVLELNNNALESVLETSQGRPLVILSVVDNHNPHPSVLPMHIKCSLEALENSNVSSQTSAPPCSFNENDESEGIWVWSRAFLLENDDDEIAIILMHLNHRNFTNISTSILELPILLSSAVVYKIDANQLENALNSLQPIFRYGQLCTDKGSDLLNDQKPLPAVCFFLDNALEAAEKSEAKDGRSAYLEERVESLDEDKRDVTWDGFNCFQKVLEFLQSPNPSPTNQVDSLLEAFLSKVLKDEDVMSKKQILGKPVTPSEFIRYFQEYVAIITNTSGTVNEDVLWNSTCAVYHNNIIASCLTAYEASVNRKIKSLDLPSSEILQISHNTALKQAKLLFKKAKMLDSFRQSYEKKLESEINSSFQVMVDKIKSIRRDAIENCSKRIVEKFETQLDSLFSNDEDAVITSKGKRLSEKLLNEFQEEFEGDDEDDLATAVDLLQQKFKRIIELYLEQQKTETESAKKEVSIFQEELIQRYTDNMQQIMDKNSFMDAETLIKFHNVNLRSVMKQLDSKSTNAKGLSVDYKRSNIEHSIQNAFSEFQKQQQANFTKLVDKAENSINDEVEAFSNTLVNKNEIDAEISELELKDFKEKELSVIIARFNKNYPFPSSSHEGVKLQVKLQERLETKYQSQIEDHLRKLEENGKENEGACILLYRKEMQANQGNVDFLLEEECLEAHQKSFNMALQRYNKCQQKSVENVADFKRKIQAEFTTIIFQNNQCLEVARSNADSWMAECLNDYNLQMEHFNSSCQTEDDFRFAHEETKANSISLFSKKWQYSNASLRQQYEKELVKQMDPIFSELEDLFLMRMTTGKVTAADSKEEVQKYYHEEMEKHFKNRHFIRPEELHALHKQARKAAIGICKKKKIITSSQKNALKQWLESSFQKYKDINDANLNWVDGAEPAIGIDLGTTFCCAAVLHHGEVKIIPNPQGKNTTPSYVTINKDGSYIVGSTAKDNAHRNTENTIFDAKRIIGRQMRDPQLQNDMTYWPFKVAQGGTGPTLDISGKHYTPEEIASYILKQIVQDASAYLQTPIKK